MSEITKVLGIPELVKESGVSAYTIRKLCHEGRLPYLEMGNRWFIRVSDFEKLFRAKVSEAHEG